MYQYPKKKEFEVKQAMKAMQINSNVKTSIATTTVITIWSRR